MSVAQDAFSSDKTVAGYAQKNWGVWPILANDDITPHLPTHFLDHGSRFPEGDQPG